MNKLQSLKAFLMYRKAVMMADQAHRKQHCRIYVMPNVDATIMLLVTDRKNFRGLRAKHYIDQSIGMTDILKKCFYFTPRGDESGQITEQELKEKQVAYQEWYERRLASLPAERKERRRQAREYRKKMREYELARAKANIKRNLDVR